MLRKDPHPTPFEFNMDVCNYLAANTAPFRKFLEPFLCFVNISRYYELDDNCYPTFLTDDDKEMDLFAFIHHVDPTKVRIGEREVREGEVPLLELTRGRVVPLAGVNEQGNQGEGVQDAGVQDVGVHVVNEESGDAAVANQIGESDHVVQDEGANIVRVKDEILATIADRAKGSKKKRKAAGGASGSSLPPKKLRAHYGTSCVGASTDGKSVAALQGLLERKTLSVKVGVAARTQNLTESFVVLSHYPCHSSSNAADVEVYSVVRSLALDPPILTTVIATTVVAIVSSVPVPRVGNELVRASIFADSTSVGTVGPDVVGPSQPASTELSADSFYVSQDMDSEMLRQIYVDKWNLCGIDYDHLFNEFNVGAARQKCLGVEVRMRLEHVLKEKKKLEGRYARQADLLKERDAEIANLKAHLSLKEAEVVEAIRLHGQVATVEATKANRFNELNGLKERNSALEEDKNALENKVAVLESVNTTKEAKLAYPTAQTTKLTKDLSELDLSCNELSVQASSLEVERDMLVSQDEQVKVLSDKVAGLDAELMGMALHLDEGMQDGLAAGIDHGKAGRGLADVAAYDPSVEANYVSAVNALDVVYFPLLAQLASQKDASIMGIMGLLHLEGHAAETSEAECYQVYTL
ncbi:hypothetical protein Tco_0695324 [Tanacetum coccineum]